MSAHAEIPEWQPLGAAIFHRPCSRTLGQRIPALHAALLGPYIHGIAGEHASFEYTPYCMTASDILYRFPEGFMLEELRHL